MDKKLTDKEFLAQIIAFYKLINFNEIIILCDLKYKILYISGTEKVLKTLPSTLVNNNFLDVLPLPTENIESILASIDKVITLRKSQDFLSINLNHTKEYVILHSNQKPIINPFTNNIVAISIESRKLDVYAYLYKLLIFLETNTLNKTNHSLEHMDKLLTLREHEIAFLLFYTKSAKKIALILNNLQNKSVSAKTIGNIISSQLYPKLKVYGLEDLIKKLYKLGYNKTIPVSFIFNMHLDLS